MRFVCVAALVAAVCLGPSVGADAAGPTIFTRQQIRSLPVTERPDRPGHFVGNAVRRRSRGPASAAPLVRAPAR